jgi:hypothetical protein
MPSQKSTAEILQEIKSITLIEKGFTIAKRKSEYWDLPNDTLSMLLENKELLSAIADCFSYVGKLKESNVDRVINKIKTSDIVDYQEWIPQFEGIEKMEEKQSTLLDYMTAFSLHLILSNCNQVVHELKEHERLARMQEHAMLFSPYPSIFLPDFSLLINAFITNFQKQIASSFRASLINSIQYVEAVKLIGEAINEQVLRLVPAKITENIEEDVRTQGIVKCSHSVMRELNRMVESKELTQEETMKLSQKIQLLMTLMNTLILNTDDLEAIESRLNDNLFTQGAFDALMSSGDINQFIEDTIMKQSKAASNPVIAESSVSFWTLPSLKNGDNDLKAKDALKDLQKLTP